MFKYKFTEFVSNFSGKVTKEPKVIYLAFSNVL